MNLLTMPTNHVSIHFEREKFKRENARAALLIRQVGAKLSRNTRHAPSDEAREVLLETVRELDTLATNLLLVNEVADL